MKQQALAMAADVTQARQKWTAEQPRLNAQRLVFLDETWATTVYTLSVKTP